MNAYEFKMTTEPSNGLQFKDRKEIKREREEIDDCHRRRIAAIDYREAKALGMTNNENSERFSSVSVPMTTLHHDIGSYSSSTTMTTTAPTKSTSSKRKRLPKSKKEKKSNRISSLQNRRRKKAWVHELEQTVYAMMKHNHSIEQKNQNLTKLIQDAEHCVEDNNLNVQEVDTNCNRNSPTMSANETVIISNPSIVTTGKRDAIIISNYEALNQPQVHCTTYQSSFSNNSDFVVNNSLSFQRNNPMCFSKQCNDMQQGFKYPVVQIQENQLMITNPINPIMDAIIVNSIVNKATASTFFDDNTNNINYSRILLHQWIEQLNQQQKQQQQQQLSFLIAASCNRV